jgi:HEAT repeat protein
MSKSKDIDRAIQTLDDPRSSGPELIEAINALAAIGSDAIPSLVKSLSGPRAARASLALGRIGSAAIPSCIDALSGPGAPYAVLALAEISSAAVLGCVDAIDGPAKTNALSALKEISGSCVDTLIKACKDDERIGGAVVALKEIGRPAMPALIETLQDSDSEVRVWGAFALGNMGVPGKEAIPALKKTAANDTDKDVREVAKEALKRITG